MKLGKSLKGFIKKTTQVLIFYIGNITLLLASDPFTKIEDTLNTTKDKISTISFVILGISFIYAAIAGAWLHRWKQAFSVIIAGALIALGPSIIGWLSKL